jgi:hypothetical protein
MSAYPPEDEFDLENEPSTPNVHVNLIYEPGPSYKPSAANPIPSPAPGPVTRQALRRPNRRRRPVRQPKPSVAPAARQSSLERHQRKCVICAHPEREAIEELFLHWHSPRNTACDFGVPVRALYSHAHATGLYLCRQDNLRAVLDRILERADRATVSNDGIIRAVRAYTCLTSDNKWVEPPSRVIFSSASAQPLVASPVGGQSLAEAHSGHLLSSADFSAQRPAADHQNLINTLAIRK